MWSGFSVVALVIWLSNAKASRGLSSRHVSHLTPISLPIHLQSPRSVQAEGGASNSISPVTMSSDKQSYFAVIQTGEISFRVALDTASSDLWIMASACSTNTCKAVPRYPLAYRSPTFLAVNDNSTTFNISYADGTVASGFAARETVGLSNLTLANQVFGIVTDCNVTMTDETSGIMGLGFPRLSTISNLVTDTAPFFVALAQQGLLDYPLFGLSLTRNASGTLSMGAVDASIVTNVSNIGWNEVVEFAPFGSESNVSSYLQWAVPLSSFSVNGTQIAPVPTYPNVTSNTSIALLDIGTAGLYGPYQDVTRLFALIPGSRLVDISGQWAVPCDTVIPISFSFGQYNYTLQSSDYLIGPAAGNPNLCLTWPRAFPPSPDAIDWQIGAAFLRTVYSIFSYGINSKEPPMIGFYPLRNASDVTGSSASVASFLSSISATVATTLPNFPLSTPSYTTPPYGLNSSIFAPVGGIVSSALATSTYSPIFSNGIVNASALPTISPSPTLATFILTNPAGVVTTSISTVSVVTVTLGVPPGWNAGTLLRVPLLSTTLVCLVSFSFTLPFLPDIIYELFAQRH